DEKFKTDVVGLKTCLKEVCKMALDEKATIHASNLLLAAVPEMTDLLKTELLDHGVSVSFYEEN
ncbi:hypothetical protein OE165_28390, partial [Escherichia coli]|uniref:hypothetical protein n=1 Tax=Escherichia coli TaxID=562 RepID=UPI0021F39DE3